LIGEAFLKHLFGPFFEGVWGPLMLSLSKLIGGEGFLHDLLIGEITGDGIDFGASFGLLTTGLFVPFGVILPYVFAFYFILSILEDSGYLPRLAVLADSILHRLGLHGMAIIPMMLGFGCNVPGILATRIMEGKRERFIATTLLAITIPCMAQIAMIIGLIGKEGVWGLWAVFGVLFLVLVVVGLLQNRFLKGESMEIFLEIPPYRVPNLQTLTKKVWTRFLWFIKEAVPWVLFGVFIANLLYSFGVIDLLGKMASPVVEKLWGLPKEVVAALLVGFLRKDVAVGMLVPLDLSQKELIVACVILTMYFPCVATFATLVKELGLITMGKIFFVMGISVICVGGLLNLLLRLI
jgi:ferrous iron transport protein B